MGWKYPEKVKQLFMDVVDGKPASYSGAIADADGVGHHGSIACGDAIVFYFTVKKNDEDPLNDIIDKVRYETFGCTSAIASSEALCCILEQMKMTPIDALSIKSSDIVDFLGGLPEQKIHCSVMGAEVLRAAVCNWASKRDVEIGPYLKTAGLEEKMEGEIICECLGLTDQFIKTQIVELEICNLDELKTKTSAGTACGVCLYRPGGLADILAQECGEDELQQAKSEPPADLKAKIEMTINSSIRPELAHQGADIELVAIKNALVYCKITAAAEESEMGKMLIKNIVEKLLKDMIYSEISLIVI